MSDKKEVLFRIRIDEGATKKNMVELGKEIENNKRVQAELNKEMQAGGVVTDQMIERQQALKLEHEALTKQLNTHKKALVAQQTVDNDRLGQLDRLRAQSLLLATAWSDLTEEEQANAEIGGKLAEEIKQVNIQIKEQAAVLKDNKQVQEYAKGSVYALREEYKQLQDQFYSLSEEERKGKVGQQMTKDIMNLHQEITKAEQSVGVFSRNVGNYTTSILDAIDGSGKLNGAIELMKQGYDKLSSIIDVAKESIMDEAKAKIAAKTATDGATTATNINKAAIISNVAALKLLKFALAATGIGAVLLLLGGLISFLTRTQSGIDKVSQYTKGFTTVIGVLTDKLSAVGEKVWDFVSGFENLGDAAKKMGQALLDHLISRLKGFLVIWEAVKSGDMTKMQDGITQVMTGIEDATAKAKAFAAEMKEVAKAGAAIEKENQRIRDAEIELNKERAKSRAEIERLKMVSDDTNKSLAERTEAARKAGEMERALLDKQVALQKQKVENIKAEQALTNNLTADNQKLAEEEAKLYELQEGSLTRQTELQNKLLSLSKEGAAQRLDATKKQLAAEAELLGIRVENALNSEEDILELQVAMLKKKTEAALLEENLSQIQILAIKEKALAEEAKLRDGFREDQRRKEIEAEERTIKQRLARAELAMKKAASRQELALKQQRANGEINQRIYEERLYTQKLIRLQSELLMMEQFKGKVEGIEQDIAAKQMEVSNLITDYKLNNQLKYEAEHAASIDRQIAKAEEQALLMGEFVDGVGMAFADSLTQQGIDLQNFTQGVLMVVLDTIEKAMTAQIAASVAQATAGSLTTPDSILTGGATGLARAAVLTALIKGAFAVAKGLITSSMTKEAPKQFYVGGYTGDGGKYEPAGIVHRGEVVWSQDDVKRAGGVRVVESMRLKGYANGGIVTPAPRITIPPSVRASFGGSASTVIDYDRLGRSVGKYVPKYIKTTDIKGGLAKDQVTASVVNQ